MTLPRHMLSDTLIPECVRVAISTHTDCNLCAISISLKQSPPWYCLEWGEMAACRLVYVGWAEREIWKRGLGARLGSYRLSIHLPISIVLTCSEFLSSLDLWNADPLRDSASQMAGSPPEYPHWQNAVGACSLSLTPPLLIPSSRNLLRSLELSCSSSSVTIVIVGLYSFYTCCIILIESWERGKEAKKKKSVISPSWTESPATMRIIPLL